MREGRKERGEKERRKKKEILSKLLALVMHSVFSSNH